MENNSERLAMRACRNSILINVFLSSFKLFAGIFGNSIAMISDAVHSITDLFSTAIAMIGIKLANKKPDKDHQYGHEKIECIATLLLAILILTVGLGIGWYGLQTILNGDYNTLTTPAIIALIAAAVSLVVKESLFWYMRNVAKKVNSTALMADAWHSRVDGLSSIGSFVGILGARLGFPIFDPLAALIICLFIVKTAYNIGNDAIGKMTDKACDDVVIEKIKAIISQNENINHIDSIKTRMVGNGKYIEVEVSIDGNNSLFQADKIAHSVQAAIESNISRVKHCSVHVNPTREFEGRKDDLDGNYTR